MSDQHSLSGSDLGQVQTLKPESSGEIKIGPDTDVLCINKGREAYRDMFDSRPYVIEPGYFVAPYGAALHFKARAVVPGSRNPETNFQASFIAIIGVTAPDGAGGLKVLKAVDPHEDWPPFTDEECAQYGIAIEALDRGGMTDAIDPADAVQVKAVAGAGNRGVVPASRVKSDGKSGGRGKKATRIEGNTELLENKGAPGTNDAIADIHKGQAARRGRQETDE